MDDDARSLLVQQRIIIEEIRVAQKVSRDGKKKRREKSKRSALSIRSTDFTTSRGRIEKFLRREKFGTRATTPAQSRRYKR